ncbi:hypothetical protein BDV97DRAFT_415405 [Delphinella strobiligena]|nr:hypothetical protein BDV97DRAFT_415405 [Delphinella strobiligena]
MELQHCVLATHTKTQKLAGVGCESRPLIPPHKRVFVPPHERGNSLVTVKTVTECVGPPSTDPTSPAPSPHVRQPSTDPPSPISYKVVNNLGKSEHAPMLAAPDSFPQASGKAQSTLVIPPRNRNDQWAKHLDLRSSRWAAEQKRSNKAPSLEWGYGAGWDDVFNPNPAKDAASSLVNHDDSWVPAADDGDSSSAFRDRQSSKSVTINGC